jgi:hypothetical protein
MLFLDLIKEPIKTKKILALQGHNLPVLPGSVFIRALEYCAFALINSLATAIPAYD